MLLKCVKNILRHRPQVKSNTDLNKFKKMKFYKAYLPQRNQAITQYLKEN